MTVFALNSPERNERAHVSAFQDTVATMCKLEITPIDGGTFQSTTRIGVLPDVLLGQTSHSPCRVRRTSALAAAGSDNVMIHMPRSGAFRMQQKGGAEVICTQGSLYIDPNEVTGDAEFLAGQTEAFYISLPRAWVEGLPGVNNFLRQQIELTPQWRMFLRYGAMVLDEMAGLTPDQVAQSAQHLRDLAASAFGTGVGDPLPGTMAARLRLIQQDMAGLLTMPDLTPDLVAARHGISTRYLRMLFADAGTSFRAYVLAQRLERARDALRSPQRAQETIADIAGAVGFSDLSWFNTCYRRRFDQTPRETRALAMLRGGLTGPSGV